MYFTIAIQADWAENFDLDNIVTPVDVDTYEGLLIEANYPVKKRKFLVNGFRNGFNLKYNGKKNVKLKSPNLILRVGDKTELWNKIMKEVAAKRYAGPFEEIPFEHYIQSPVGLVPKDHGKKTRLIFHLSYPRNPKDGKIISVNGNIPEKLCKVKYPDFDEAVKLCLDEGVGCYIGKSDMSMAFRNIPMRKQDFCWLVLKAYHPVTGKLYYFVDKCLPFGSSISCAHFQAFSNSVAYLVKYRTKKRNVNYLDDFFFARYLRMLCNGEVNIFLEICKTIQFPVSLEKTFWGTTRLTFLGLLLDTVNQMVCIPKEKIDKARQLISYIMNKKNKKVTVLHVQKMTGFLNFLCKCVIPGRAFTMRFYSIVPSNMKPHYHIKITEEMRLDVKVWSMFLDQPDVYCRPFMDFKSITAEDIEMYSDASKSWTKGGFGALCQKSWMYSAWDYDYMCDIQPSIQYLELFGVAAAVLTWIHRFKNKKIYLFCDNDSVVKMINKSSSRCKNCMVLLRFITIEGLKNNVRIFAKHIGTKKNVLADALSRLRLKKFRKLAPQMENEMTPIPEEIWPVNKIWRY